MIVSGCCEILEAVRVAADGRDHRAAIEELARHIDRLVEQSARVVARLGEEAAAERAAILASKTKAKGGRT